MIAMHKHQGSGLTDLVSLLWDDGHRPMEKRNISFFIIIVAVVAVPLVIIIVICLSVGVGI